MKIGSFLIILLAALVALGYLLSDSFHLREDLSDQQKEIERLTRVMKQTEQEKQDALVALQNANQNLQSCQQEVEQSKLALTSIIEENIYLKEQNQMLASRQSSVESNTTRQLQTATTQSAAYSLIVLVILGIGSLTVTGLKGRQVKCNGKPNGQGKGHYVFLSQAEIVELIQRRRKSP